MSIVMKLIVNVDVEVCYLSFGELDCIKVFVIGGVVCFCIVEILIGFWEIIVK